MKFFKPRPVIALVLARGGIKEFPNHSHLKYKALLPYLGQPLIAYVVDALTRSSIEKVFVLQERDAELQLALQPHPKIVFINHDGPSASVAKGLVFGLEKILSYYEGQTDRMIAILPCDIPLVQHEEVNDVVGQLEKLDADVVFTSIRLSALGGLQQRLTIYSPELGEQTASQNLNFISGRCFNLDECGHLLVIDKDGNKIDGIDQVLDSMRKHRNSFFLWLRLIYQFYGSRMLKRGHYILFVESIARLIMGRLNMPIVKKVYGAVANIDIDVIISTYPSFSFDVDNPTDYTRLTSTFPEK